MFELRDNYATADLKEVGSVTDGFQLPTNSPAWKLGFKPIPFDQIGLRRYVDRERLGTFDRAALMPEGNLAIGCISCSASAAASPLPDTI